MAGFGFLRHMIDSIKQNTALKGSKKSLRELTKDSHFKYGNTGDPAQLENVVRLRSEKRRKERIRNQLIAISIAIFFLFFGYFITQEYYSPQFDKEKTLYTVKVTRISDNEFLRTHYFMLGGKAQDMRFKNGLRHQHSESYYESGYQFRSALYYYDTLVTEVFFSPEGDTLELITKTEMHDNAILLFRNRQRNKLIQVGYIQGRILPSTLQIKNMPDSLR